MSNKNQSFGVETKNATSDSAVYYVLGIILVVFVVLILLIKNMESKYEAVDKSISAGTTTVATTTKVKVNLPKTIRRRRSSF